MASSRQGGSGVALQRGAASEQGRRFADVAGVSRLDAAKLKAELQPLLDGFVERLVEAVEGARVGHLVDDAEEPARQAGLELVRAALQAALQQKVDALEASFSPSGDDGR